MDIDKFLVFTIFAAYSVFALAKNTVVNLQKCTESKAFVKNVLPNSSGVLCVEKGTLNFQFILYQPNTRRKYILTTQKKFTDQYYEIVNFKKYNNTTFVKPAAGYGVRLVYPEKSSVIYYWDNSKKTTVEFWESD